MLNLNINGSRAIAVLLVFLFHVNLDTFGGGYIGVDIFFVISGYVITNSLYNTFNSEKKIYPTILIFYKKRILRILPAILVLSIILIIFAKIFFLEKHYFEFLKSIFFSNLFVSNFFFWNQYGYFGIENSFKPMLHTWSLSIEAQIYLIFPFFIYLLYKKNLKTLTIFILFLSIISIFFAELYIDRPLVYFFPIFRIHEFFLGTALFIYLNILNKKKLDKNFIYLGLFIIFLSALYLNKNSSFPGFNSILPLIGISIIILSKENNFFSYNKVVQFYGKISYSFYLYHWPIVVFYKYFFLKTYFNFLDIFYIFVFTTFFATVSYNLIELKFKNLGKRNIEKIALTLSLIFIISSGIQQNSYDLKNRKISFYEKEVEKRRLFEKKINNNLIVDNSKKTIFFLGDSHAIDLLLAFNHQETKLKNFNVSYIGLNNDCLKYLKKKTIFSTFEELISSKFNLIGGYCGTQIKKFKKEFVGINNQYIFISNRWSKDSLKYLDFLIHFLKKNKNNIFIVGRRPSFFDIPSLIQIKKEENKINLEKISFDLNDKNVDKINYLIRSIAKREKLKFVDIYSMICDKKNKRCKINDFNNNILFIDNDHFSLTGSRYFGKELKSIFKNLIRN